jgi:hypothetical protein
VYQAVAALARQRFGASADISFTYLNVPGIEQPAHSPPPAVEPAIIVEFTAQSNAAALLLIHVNECAASFARPLFERLACPTSDETRK